MDLDLDQSNLDFRAEVRSWLEANVPAEPLPSMDTAEGFEAHRQWERTMADARMSVVSWPKEYGGRDCGLANWVIFEEEYYRVGAPGRVSQNGIFLLAPTLFEHASTDQLDVIMPRMARADDVWAQAWSEPESGSDLASLRSTAKKVDGGWILNGQKTWSSRATFADKGFGLFRSDPEQSRHRGLTYFMFDLRAEGVTVRPIDQLDGEPGFAELFLQDVFVPDDPAHPAESGVIGQVNNGWKVAMSTANNERGLSLRSPGRFLATTDRLVRLWNDRKENLDARTRGRLADEVVDSWIGSRAYELSTWGTVTTLSEGGNLGAESSINKVFWSEWDINTHTTALELLGPAGELADPVTVAGEQQSWMDGYLFALAGPIYAGTNEIQKNVIAERLLGLPRGDR